MTWRDQINQYENQTETNKQPCWCLHSLTIIIRQQYQTLKFISFCNGWSYR